jgi:uncharacterized membrane protein YdjX (TVP38/TMEM64 family)
MSPKQRLILVIVLALLIPIVPFVIIGELPGERWLSANDEHSLVFGLTGAALLVSDVLLPIPSSIVGTLLGARLGLMAGFIWAFSGLMLGSTIGYASGRWLLSPLQANAPAAPTLALLFVSRPVPIFAEALIVAAGATRIGFTRSMLACAAGNGVYAAALSASGATFIPAGWATPALALALIVPAGGWWLWRQFGHT